MVMFETDGLMTLTPLGRWKVILALETLQCLLETGFGEAIICSYPHYLLARIAHVSDNSLTAF